MKTGELCNREVITASRDTSIAEAARLMRDHHVGSLIIVESRDGRTEPVGILTDRDIVIEVIAEDVALADVTIGDVMSFALLKVSEDESILETTQRMRARGVRRAPVVAKDCSLVGIVAIDDILQLLSEELLTVSRLMAREAEQEKQKRSL